MLDHPVEGSTTYSKKQSSLPHRSSRYVFQEPNLAISDNMLCSTAFFLTIIRGASVIFFNLSEIKEGGGKHDDDVK